MPPLMKPPSPRAGQLNQRVTIQYRTVALDALGGETDTWLTLRQVWAMIEEKGGEETMDGSAPTAMANIKATVRFSDDIGVENRLLYRGRTLEIVNTSDPDGRRATLILTCREKVT